MTEWAITNEEVSDLKKKYGEANITTEGVKFSHLLKIIKENDNDSKGLVPTSRIFIDFTDANNEEIEKLRDAVHREYGLDYNKTHKTSTAKEETPRPKIKIEYSFSNLMHSSYEKSLKIIKGVLEGKLTLQP